MLWPEFEPHRFASRALDITTTSIVHQLNMLRMNTVCMVTFLAVLIFKRCIGHKFKPIKFIREITFALQRLLGINSDLKKLKSIKEIP